MKVNYPLYLAELNNTCTFIHAYGQVEFNENYFQLVMCDRNAKNWTIAHINMHMNFMHTYTHTHTSLLQIIWHKGIQTRHDLSTFWSVQTEMKWIKYAIWVEYAFTSSVDPLGFLPFSILGNFSTKWGEVYISSGPVLGTRKETLICPRAIFQM